MEALGIDIGGVIVSADTDTLEKTNVMMSEKYLATKPKEHCFEVIKNLGAQRFGERIYLVSKAGSIMQMKSRRWLDHHDFFKITGVDPCHIAFCLERKDKARIARQLNLTHFIDDRLEILSYLDTVPHRYAFQPRENELTRYAHILKHITVVQSWEDIQRLLL